MSDREWEIVRVPRDDDDRVGDAWRPVDAVREQTRFLEYDYEEFAPTWDVGIGYLATLEGSDQAAGSAIATPSGRLPVLAVHPDWWGEGAGSAIVEQLLEEHDVVRAHVRVSNERALEFYHRHDFQVYRRKKGYYSDGEDAFVIFASETNRIGVDVLGHLPTG